jgi:hypothetical protein
LADLRRIKGVASSERAMAKIHHSRHIYVALIAQPKSSWTNSKQSRFGQSKYKIPIAAELGNRGAKQIDVDWEYTDYATYAARLVSKALAID